MTDRFVKVAVCVSAVVILGVHSAYKDWPTDEQIRQMASSQARTQNWVGRIAPEFEMRLLDGSTFRLSDAVGRQVIVLNFFATWCGPCRVEMPELQRYHALNGESGMLLLGVDAEEKTATVEGFVRELGLTFPVGIDDSGRILRSYEVETFPTTIVIGADGRVKLRESGAILNADVSLGAVIRPEFDVLRAGQGVARNAYLAALEAEPPERRGDQGLDERSQRIADAMPCPCGCSDRVAGCGCQTAKGITERLKQGGFGEKTDAQIMEALNAEFCMKGM